MIQQPDANIGRLLRLSLQIVSLRDAEMALVEHGPMDDGHHRRLSAIRQMKAAAKPKKPPPATLAVQARRKR